MSTDKTNTGEVLEQLAVRVESATGPSEELDALIRCALWAPEGATVEQSPINGAWCVYSGEDRAGRPRLFDRPIGVSWDIWRGNFTASLDAAMTLVPDRYCPGVSQSVHHLTWHAWMGDQDADGPFTVGESDAATPALALTAAALRARAQS